MSARVAFLLVVFSLSAPAQSPIVDDVRAAIAQNNLAGAEQMARGFQARTGPRPDTAAALSWLARANLATKNLDRADAYASEAQQMASRFLTAAVQSLCRRTDHTGLDLDPAGEVTATRGSPRIEVSVDALFS